MRNISVFLTGILSMGIISIAPAPAAFAGEFNPIVRVCIMDESASVQVTLQKGHRITAVDSGKTILSGPALTADIRATKNGLRIGKSWVKTTGIRIHPSADASIYIDHRKFRGDIEIHKKDNSRIEVINYIPLEEYLYGVIHREVSYRWPLEALKAQAIAARTFALYQMRQSRLKPYDLRSDVYSQVYGGSGSEKWKTSNSVDLTRGQVLTYHGTLFPTYFHATCAGFTENASNLWEIDMPTLKGVECVYCEASPHYRWTKAIPLWWLEAKLRKGGYAIGRISSCMILSRNASGRVDKVQLQDSSNISVILTGKEFRQLIGPNDLRSTNFEASIRFGQLVLSGRGWGHGVGMCQWGGFGLAKHGKSAEEILLFYYPESEITSMAMLRD